MARSIKSDVIIPDLFDAAVQGAFAQKKALMGSPLASMGAAVIAGDMPAGGKEVGSTIKVPYFSVIGDFETISTDGDALTPAKLAQTSESATVGHSGLAFEMTTWAQSNVGDDLYSEAGRQLVESAQRKMDSLLITAATAAGGLWYDVYSTTSPVYLNYDLMVAAKMLWGDEQDDIVGMMVHSKVFGDLLKLRDGVGQPLLTIPADGSLPRFLGVPVGVSDRMPVAATMGAVTEAGTTPPDIAITTNTPLQPWNLKIVPVTTGARGTATIKFSLDGGQNYSDPILTAASIDLIDPAVDSLVGIHGKSGLTISYENASSAANNVWTASSTASFTSSLFKSQSLAFWYNRSLLSLLTDKDILRHTDLGALHLYSVAHRYRRRRGGYRPGVVNIKHNVSL